MKKWTLVFGLGLLAWLGVVAVNSAGVEPIIYAPAVFKPVNTPTPTFTPTPTNTPVPTNTPTATATQQATAVPTATRTPTATATQPPAGTGNVQITAIFADGDGANEPNEYVQIQNQDSISIQLNGWTLSDEANHVFTFPSFVIAPNQTCRVYTNESHPEWCGFNYQSGSAIWNNGGDCGTLRNGSNALIDQFCY